MNEKLANLKTTLRNYGSLAVAFSGGVDSTFLLKVAQDVLDDQVLAVTIRSPLFPHRESQEALKFVTDNQIPHETIDMWEQDMEGFADNPPNRCYLCKRRLFSQVIDLAHEMSIPHVADGSNVDDLSDYRPGIQALRELGVVSPLQEAQMTKRNIRQLSRDMNLPTWNKPTLACLASRFPYGHRISKDKLLAVDQAEQFLKSQGFRQVRVRHHGDTARIEVGPEERTRFFDAGLMDCIYEAFQRLGFTYTALDLKGYRMGSMNETIT
ncbi:MAG: ATP-dependent sacrificial sulfur transferase LarE [Deltaproteobacteria bacterium]|nr:ATP-dependent sacrificial sulfur transferase LarE [Deltaproteobacteria bacterium]